MNMNALNMNKYSPRIAAHTDVCHIEFNNRKFSIRDAIRITNDAGVGDIIDIVSDVKTHTIIVSDCYECVYLREIIVGMNVYDRVMLMDDDEDNVSGITVVKLKTIQYFNEEMRVKHMKYCEEKLKNGCILKPTGGMRSPDSSEDSSYEDIFIAKKECAFN